MSCGDVVLACVYVVLSTKSFVSNAPTNRKNQACVGNKCKCVCFLRYCEPTDTSDSTLRLYFCLRFRVVFNPNAWCKRAPGFFFFLYAFYFCRSLSFATNALNQKPRINQIARFVVIVSCVFVHFSTLTSGANARLRFFSFICACYFCICVRFATPAIFRNPRLLHFARYVVIFACVFAYFVTITLGANASRRFFLPLCAYFFANT